jgi:probable FeS assembly SUF system protein SufT
MMQPGISEWVCLHAPTPAIEIPMGTPINLPAEMEVSVVHQLGGDFTIRSRYGAMYRVAGHLAAHLGKEQPSAAAASLRPFSEALVREALATCYDPEIPVNIVELGLVYEMVVQESEPEVRDVHVKMTLTAPGCGMGEVIVNDAQRKLEALPTVRSVKIELTFDPPWGPEKMSEAARLELGM